MTGRIDYRSLVVPAEKDPTTYTYAERRAELLQLIEEAGHPRAVNQTEIATRYDVSQQQISEDMKVLSEYVAEHVGAQHRFIMQSVFQGSMLELIESGESFKAAKVARWWAEWLDDTGATRSEPLDDPSSEPLTSGLDEEAEVFLDWVTHDTGDEATTVTDHGPEPPRRED